METTTERRAVWQQVAFPRVTIKDRFWKPRLESLNRATFKTCLEKCEETGRISNFAKAAGLMEGKHEGIFFNDSDVYKLLEGIAYSLTTTPDAALEAEADRIIGLIAAAQEEDGYLLTYFTLEHPELKWTDMDKHEMYCGGHLIEAAVAYFEATGKRTLLDVACKLADHYDNTFGVGKRHWVEGHEEIELALVKLYRVTGEARYWKLALWLLEEQGPRSRRRNELESPRLGGGLLPRRRAREGHRAGDGTRRARDVLIYGDGGRRACVRGAGVCRRAAPGVA
ncbi:beta-L-arabinofuranosidase domain-containing protein [Paenibacillus sp.]|uniref:beta-L-arabinofuranosidase domain-containing protein n=1 Tax=Paenibacillus sp. TaxID=58172 RepID=UPI002D2428F3|nr:beta-L-arabinofuranosidase domain-containing protein [Paenibacillus sp.]HZG55126.1 beta-L-arabinofuranosidase domain-containing protein [Paenibacillus sp.]